MTVARVASSTVAGRARRRVDARSTPAASGGCRVDHQQQVFAEVVGDGIVEDVRAGLVAQQAVLARPTASDSTLLVDARPAAASRPSHGSRADHVRQVEQTGRLAHRLMLGDDAAAVLDRHVPAAEGHHPRPGGDVQIVQGGLELTGYVVGAHTLGIVREGLRAVKLGAAAGNSAAKRLRSIARASGRRTSCQADSLSSAERARARRLPRRVGAPVDGAARPAPAGRLRVAPPAHRAWPRPTRANAPD